MANFQDWVKPGTRRHRRIEAGFQNIAEDKGNWTGCERGIGQQSGTNMSISACKLTGVRGYPVSVADMKALTRAEALAIYKSDYWDKIMGDQIKSQTIANFVADMKSSAGGNGVKEFQKALNTLGANIAVDGAFGSQTLAATNAQLKKLGGTAKLNNVYQDNMVAYYTRVGTGDNAKFKDGWISSLKEDYPKMSETADKAGVPEWLNNRTYWAVGATIVVVVVVAFVVYKYA